MGALVVVEVLEVKDKEQFAQYQAGARAQFLARGGVAVARGGVAFEGTPPDGPILVQRWPSEQAFRDWQSSEEYRPLLELRKKVAKVRLLIVPEV